MVWAPAPLTSSAIRRRKVRTSARGSSVTTNFSIARSQSRLARTSSCFVGQRRVIVARPPPAPPAPARMPALWAPAARVAAWPPPRDPSRPPAEALGSRQRLLVLAAMCLALVLVIAGVSMLAVGLPSIGQGLGLGQTTLTWVADAYALTLASLLLLAGALGDRFGRRGALLAGIALFGMGSLLSGLAHSGGQLVAFRALTGLGGALIMPGTLSTITSVFPPEERARAVGIWAGFAGAGGTLGMLAAGWMLGPFAWPAIFFAPAALSVLTFAVIVAFVPNTRSSEHVGLDPIGTVLSAVGIGGLVLGIIQGPIPGRAAPPPVTRLPARVVLAAALV